MRLSDKIIEEAGRRIYESQQARLSDQTSFAAKRAWRSMDVPASFWDSYCDDARAALSLTRTGITTENYRNESNNLAAAQLPRSLGNGSPIFHVGSALRAEWAEGDKMKAIKKETNEGTPNNS